MSEPTPQPKSPNHAYPIRSAVTLATSFCCLSPAMPPARPLRGSLGLGRWTTSHHTMKPHIVPDGASRLRRSPEFQAHLRRLRESIRARHSAEFAAAGIFRRLVLRWRIAAEFRAERGKIEPSSGSLYTTRIVARGA